jgi:Fe-S oxidoreductase/nitrate reductase gamma subunit
MPGWAEALWYVLAAVSVLIFAYGVARPIAKYRRGDGQLPPLREVPGRLRLATKTLVAHSSIRRRDRYAGWAHRGIFYGFVVLFIGTVILGVNTDITEPLLGWRFFTGDFYLYYSVILDVLGVALLVGVLLMMFRRAVLRPRKLDYRVADWVFVGSLLYLVVTGYALEGIRIAMDNPGYNAYSPAGWVSAQVWDGVGVSGDAMSVLRHVGWWSHGLVALAFVASIPYTKAAHMLVSFAGLVLKDPLAGKRLRGIPEERAMEPAGYVQLSDFSIPHLIQLDACTRCGKCHEACPANATGLPLSPRDLILELRDEAADGRLDVDVVGRDRVHEDTLWSCMQCNACVEICPVGIEQAPIINQMRRGLVEQAEMEPLLQKTLETIQKSGNSFGERARKRGRWTDGLDFEVKDARSEDVDVLWFVGDYASFDPRSQEVTRSIARLLRSAGVDFGILYEGERNAGNDVRRVGEEGLFELLASQNIEVLQGCSFDRIITSDPHSLNTLRNEYPELGGEWEVAHHTAFLLELLEAGDLQIENPLSYRITYHDPCYLGRFNGGYDAPRAILEHLGCELVEMPRCRDNSFCCGAGGGRIWMTEPAGDQRPSENRIEEAVGLGALDYFVVSCPKDVTMFEDAIKTSGHSDALELRELTELLEEAVRGPATVLST